MQLYDILKAGKTDKAPDSRTLLLARKLFPPPNSGLPVTRGLRSVLYLADFDGNGRIGRLIMLKQCLANEIVPFFINEDIKHFYYVGLKEWQLEEKPNRLLDVFLTMQDDMKAILDYFKIDYNRTDLTARELINKHI